MKKTTKITIQNDNISDDDIFDDDEMFGQDDDGSDSDDNTNVFEEEAEVEAVVPTIILDVADIQERITQTMWDRRNFIGLNQGLDDVKHRNHVLDVVMYDPPVIMMYDPQGICRACNHVGVYRYNMQTRSADEAETSFVYCKACGNVRRE